MKTELTHGQIASFWGRIGKADEKTGCTTWSGGKNGLGIAGYGIVWFSGKKYKCHRLAYLLSKGPIPPGAFVCHKCDNPPCCNPDHLFIGSPLDNVRDCLSKGRGIKEHGSKRYNAKLTEEAVVEIKEGAKTRTYGWGRRMAIKFGVVPSAINNIVMGRRWTRVKITNE